MNPNEQYTMEHHAYYGDGYTSEFFDFKIGVAVSMQFSVTRYDGEECYVVEQHMNHNYEDYTSLNTFDSYADVCEFVLYTARNKSFAYPSL